jgi:twitching motility protein PilT
METETPILSWLETAVSLGASDLHVVCGHQPTVRVHGTLRAIDGPPLDHEAVAGALFSVCPTDVVDRFKSQGNADFALQLLIQHRPQRFRANYYVSNQDLGACFRVIPSEIPDLTWAGFPESLAQRLTSLRNGLVLITGVTGAGKTTTLAMLLDVLNQAGGYRIITVEDPIEYIFPRVQSSIVTQREVGRDVQSFADGLRYGLRQDPDVILVGEIRDRETAQMALSAAETGHLVFSTLHTRDAKGAVSRFTDLVPQGIQSEIRSQLSMSLRAVVTQHLLPSIDEGKRELALEIMFNSTPIASAIRMGKIESIDTGIVTGRSEGMLTLDESVRRLFEQGKISREVANRFSGEAYSLRR